MKLNQEGTMDGEWGMNDFQPSAGRWFQRYLDHPEDCPEGLPRRMVLGSLGFLWVSIYGRLRIKRK